MNIFLTAIQSLWVIDFIFSTKFTDRFVHCQFPLAYILNLEKDMKVRFVIRIFGALSDFVKYIYIFLAVYVPIYDEYVPR